MKTNRILLLIDLSYQTYRASAAHPQLSSRGAFTGGLYGFFVTLAKTIRDTQATDLIFCQDRKPYVRSHTYPEYKQIRKSTMDPELKARSQESMGYILEVLDAIGHTVWGVDGFESDDLIAHGAIKYRHRFDRIIAGTNDSDLFQLFYLPDFYVYTQDLATMMGAQRFAEKHKVSPAEFMTMSALTGTHNDIEGIHGVGPATALKAVRDPVRMANWRHGYGALIDRNLELIRLPHPGLPRIVSLPEQPRCFDHRHFVRLLGRYDIAATASMTSAFQQLAKD